MNLVLKVLVGLKATATQRVFNPRKKLKSLGTVTHLLLRQFKWGVFLHPRIAPTNFHLFPKLKNWLGGHNFQAHLKSLAGTFFDEGIKNFVQCNDKCLNLHGDYAEKQPCLSLTFSIKFILFSLLLSFLWSFGYCLVVTKKKNNEEFRSYSRLDSYNRYHDKTWSVLNKVIHAILVVFLYEEFPCLRE